MTDPGDRVKCIMQAMEESSSRFKQEYERAKARLVFITLWMDKLAERLSASQTGLTIEKQEKYSQLGTIDIAYLVSNNRRGALQFHLTFGRALGGGEVYSVRGLDREGVAAVMNHTGQVKTWMLDLIVRSQVLMRLLSNRQIHCTLWPHKWNEC